jgi:predicted DCC family thiol-disulfide oxidoreductase YuxK
VLAIANQKPGVLERYGLTRDEADRAAWTIDRDGRKLEGAAAINRTLHELGGGWRVLAALYRVKPVAALQEIAYRWIAPRRSALHRLGITPECDEPGAGCTT